MTVPFSEKRIYLIGGPGGVGKTTLAASLAIHFSVQGYRTLVLTVDPAKRLAQTLGLTSFSTELRKVTLTEHPQAELHAYMLDGEHAFDRIIARFAKNEQQKQKILENSFYRTIVESLGGSHEYAAMEQILAFASDPQFDKIIVDTPPTQNAIDLFKAPQRLADFMDAPVISWFQKKGGFQLFQKGSQLAMKALQNILGSEFLEQLALFLTDLQGMQSGFRERHLAVMEVLRGNTTAFILVTQASEARFLESLEFQKALNQENIPISQLILNRLERYWPPLTSTQLPEAQRTWLLGLHDYFEELHTLQEKWANAFKSEMGVPTVNIQRLSHPTTELQTLLDLGNQITGRL